jgi:lipopolysaccharide export system permease protein
MSTSVPDRPGHAASSAIGHARMLAAPFGWHTRYLLRSHVRHTFVITLAFLALALTIDLSPRLTTVLAANPDAHGLGAVLHVAWYATLRSADILTRLFPIACFLGVVWSEIAHTWSRERIVVWNSGRSPAQCLAPVLLFGLFAGSVQFALDCYLRPAAVATQIAAGLGDYAARFDRLTRSMTWLAADNDFVSARIEYGPPPVLHEVTVYRFTPQGRLHRVVAAQSAVPGSKIGRWRLREMRAWELGETLRSSAEQAPSDEADGALIAEREVALNIDPLWTSYMGISPKLLPQDVLLALARPNSDTYPIVLYRTWKHVRFAQAILPGAMALFGTVLSIFLLAYGTRAEVLLGIGLAGYAAHLLIKVCVLLGEREYISALTAAWFMPVLLLGVSAVLLWVMGRGRFGGTYRRA